MRSLVFNRAPCRLMISTDWSGQLAQGKLQTCEAWGSHLFFSVVDLEGIGNVPPFPILPAGDNQQIYLTILEWKVCTCQPLLPIEARHSTKPLTSIDQIHYVTE